MASDPNIEEKYPDYINKSDILGKFRNETIISRSALLSDYNLGYGNLTGFHLSYNDVLLNKNSSDNHFSDGGLSFIEDEKYSILPNLISRKASNVWNIEGKVVDLPDSRDDLKDEKIGNKLNTGDFHLNITGSLRGFFDRIDIPDLKEIPLPLPNYLFKLYDYRTKERIGRSHQSNDSDNDDDSIDNQNLGYLSDEEIIDELNTRRTGNFTKPNGSIKLQFFSPESHNKATVDNDGNTTTLIALSLKLNDDLESDEHSISLSGVYHQDTGNILVITRSAKFNGIYALPELNLVNDSHFNRSRWALFNEFNETKIEDMNFDSVENLVDSSDECEYIGYFHMESTNLTTTELRTIDNELSNPIGRPHKEIPDLKISSGLLYSPNCAVVLDVSTLTGKRDEVYDNTLRNVILVLCVILSLQIFVLIRQMAYTNTPSTLSKLSFWTIALMNMQDGALSVISLLCSMIYTDLYVQFAVCAFLAFTCSAIYEVKYGVQIYCTQINERPVNWRTMLQGTTIDEIENRAQNNEEPTNEGTNTDSAADTNNRTTNTETDTANNATPTPIVTQPADEQTVGAELYTRHFFAVLIFLFCLLNVITWPKRPRQIFEYFFITIFNSYWIPQVYRNTLKGSRSSFSWEFVISTSILRLIPVIYIETFDNPFNHHKDLKFTTFLIIWMTAQILMLYLQELLGARFFLSNKYLPASYDYHPLITKGDIESGFSIGVEDLISDGASSTNEDSRNLKYVTDCAICMQTLEVPILNSSSDLRDSTSSTADSTSLLPGITKSTVNIIARRKYMVTPCRHIFHTECLENWMMYKLQCPVCRTSLPPA